MKKTQVTQNFIEACYENEKNLHKALKADRLAVQQAWEVFIDSLCKDGQITMQQYESWIFPWA